MNVLEALLARSTIRAFKPDPIKQEVINDILNAALRTPSWANTQPWEIFCVSGEPLERIRSAFAENLKKCEPRKPDINMPKDWPVAHQLRMDLLKRERLAAMEQACKDPADLQEMLQMNYRFFNAPVVMYACMDRSLSPWSLFDMGAFCQSTMLAALEHGIGSAVAITLVGHPEIIRRELHLPDQMSIVIGVALGYPDTTHPQNVYRTKRRSLEEAVRFMGF